MLIALLTLVACDGLQQESPRVATEKPPALRAAELARDKANIRTGLIEYGIRERVGDSELESERFYTWRCAADAIAVSARGDEVGVGLPWKPSLEGEIQGYSGVVHFLLAGTDLWMHREDAIYADVWGSDKRGVHQVFDIRRLGLNPLGVDQAYEDFAQAAGLPPIQYTAEREGGLAVVTASAGESSVRWWIDPEQNWGIVRTAAYAGPAMLGETHYRLEEIDGVWFPVQMEHFGYGEGPTDRPRRVISIYHAEFNRPDHPQVLLPATIGVEPGTSVTYHDRKQPHGIFDGVTVVSPEEFFKRLQSGELKRGPTVSREIARLRAARRRAAEAMAAQPAMSPATQPAAGTRAGWESEWERYTREFITRFALDTEQTQRALSILKDCQERGQRFIRARRSEFDRLEGQLADARRAADTQAVAALEEQAAVLRAPLDEIFERQLKPRLDRLPTKQQRAAAEVAPRPTSAPARR